MKISLNKHWEKVGSGWRHIVSDMQSDKKKRLLDVCNKYFIEKIDTKIIENSLDWGCGGGLLTKELQKFSKVSVVDISEDSLNKCENYTKPFYKQLIHDDINSFLWSGPSIDFIFCHALVWHFPNITYFKKVLKIWDNLNPTYIAFNIKTIKTGYQETNSYSKNFLHALKLSEEMTEELMSEIGYTLNSKELVNSGRLPQTYYTFKK